ncbi:HEAT repeat containing protein [Theileria orientalis strain Shintoku]|uniref:HEAT repeat containing protein n=1 Tax=Theileria orientalis strain Shintoku TaxID=869250 RepID=J4D5E3_THEOR|nr:HEAT repeat containing protein [Theileria orientalis strain Shintoku]BAM38900.1 HEAT repeat containing protein [Theileria orientalis strain Shintoku]|eukprot:XP_009689201.1 HEAT repeat containing protein [Theileria orientalis strain Shintoku]
MTNQTQIKEEQMSVVRDPSTQVNNSEGDSAVYQFENMTLEQVANEVEESRRFDLLKSYLLQLSSCDYLEQSDVVSDANYLRKLVRSEDTQLQTKVAELLLQYVRLMKVNTVYDTKLGGIQDSMLLYKLYQVVHDDSCHYLLPNLKAGEVFSKFLCTLLSIASSEYVFNSVVRLYQRTVQNILNKYKRDSGAVEEMSTDDARVVIAVMKMLLTLTRSFGSPPAPSEVLCSLSVAVVNSTKAHLCRLYSYNLMAFLIRDITDKQTIDNLLNGLDAAQRNQVTSLVKESTSLNNTCNWRFKHSPVDVARRNQNDQTSPNNANVHSSPYNQQTADLANQAQNESTRQQKTGTKDWERTPSRNYMNTLTQNDQSRRLQSPLPGVVPRSPQSISRYNARSGSSSSNSSVIYRSGDDNGISGKDKEAYDQRKQKNSLGTPSRPSGQGPLPSNWYRDLFKTFDTNRGEGKNVVVDKNAWKLKNDQLIAALTLLDKYDKVDLEGVSPQFVKLFELLLKNESAIPVVVNSLNLFTMLLVKSECDLLTVSKSHTLADLLFQKLKDSNKKVRDACIQALVEVTKRCRLTVVSESVKKALSNVSPTCRENMCNFLNGKVVPTSDAGFFEKLKQLLTILADDVRQIRSDKVPKVRSALASLLDVLDDFDLVYANRPATAGHTEDAATQVVEGAKTTANEFVLTKEQQASLVIDDSERVLTTANTTSSHDTTTVTSYYDAESGSEFNVPQLDQQPATVAAAQPTSAAPSAGTTEAVSANVVPSDTAAAEEGQQEVKSEPLETANVTTRVSFADQSVNATRVANRGVAQADRAPEDGSGQVQGQAQDAAARTVRLPSVTSIDPRTGVERRKIVAVNSLQKAVDEKVLDEFKTNDVAALNRALYNLTQWMANHRRVQKVNDYYLLRLVNEYHRDFREPDVLQKFYTLMCKEELSEEGLTELMLIVKKYKEPMVMVSLMLTNNRNIDRFLNPVNYAYATMILSVFETISTTVSRQYLSIDTDLQVKIMDFLAYFVKTSKDPYATKASEVLWVLDDTYGIFKYLDDRQVNLLKFSRPSKDLKTACRTAESRIRKYVSSELYSCMFELDHERKKKACSFWKGYLGNSSRKRDEMLMSDSRKDLIAWLACCLFENKCERVAIELFEMMVDYLETMELKFSLEESMWLAECFLSYATFGKNLSKALAVFTKVSKMMKYSLEIAKTMCSYLESIEFKWVEVIKEALEEVARTETADHELYAYVSRKLMSNSNFRNSIDEAKTLVNSETSSQMNEHSPLNAGSISQSQAESLLAIQQREQREQGESAQLEETEVDPVQELHRVIHQTVHQVAQAQQMHQLAQETAQRVQQEVQKEHAQKAEAERALQAAQQQQVQQQQVQQAEGQQVDANVAGRMVQRVVSNAQAPESSSREASLESSSQTLNDLNEKYKKPTPSLETLTTNPSLEAVETLTTNRSLEAVETLTTNRSLEAVETLTTNRSNSDRTQELENSNEFGQLSQETGREEEVAPQNIMQEVILGEDVTMDLESCRSLSQQIVEKPVRSLEQQPKASKPPYMSATLEETRYVFVGDCHGSDKKATAEAASQRLEAVMQGVHEQLQRAKSKRRKLNTGDARKGGREEEEEEVADRRGKSLRANEKRTNEEEARLGDKDKDLQSRKVHADLSRLVRSYERPGVVQNLEDEDEDEESEELEQRRVDRQKSASVSRLIDKEASKYHPYIQSLTGNLAPAAALEQENECSSSDERLCLDTVSADAKEGRDSNEGTATRSESRRSLVDMAGYEEEKSAKRPFSTNVARAVDFVDSDPDCLRDDLGLSLVETVLSLCSRVNDVCLVSSYREYQSLLPTLYPADVPATLAQTFGQVLRHRGALKGTFLRLLTAPLLEASHNALLLLTKMAYKNVQAGESTAALTGAIVQALEVRRALTQFFQVFRLVTGRLQEKSVLRFCNVVTNLLALPKALFQDEKLYSLVSSLVSENALKQPKSVMYKLLDVMIEVSMESLGGELDRLMMAKLRFTKILQMQILVGLRNTDAGLAPESEALRQKHMAFIGRLESYLRTSRAQNVDNVIRTSNYIVRTI